VLISNNPVKPTTVNGTTATSLFLLRTIHPPFLQPPAIMDSPIVSSGTQERRKEARDQMTSEIDAAFGAYMKMLDDIAVKYGRCVFMSQQ
jgi:hypothetical protein